MAPYIKFNWHGAKIASLVEVASRHSALEAAKDLLERANEHVPLEFGFLKSTGIADADGNKGVVSYSAVYAAKLHQHPEYNFRGAGTGRWLQNAVEEGEQQTLEAFAKPIKKVL